MIIREAVRDDLPATVALLHEDVILGFVASHVGMKLVLGGRKA